MPSLNKSQISTKTSNLRLNDRLMESKDTAKTKFRIRVKHYSNEIIQIKYL